jgi:hypothetical protein
MIFLDTRRTNGLLMLTWRRLKKAQDDAASLTPEIAASRMTPEESKRLSRVRNIGIAVRNRDSGELMHD